MMEKKGSGKSRRATPAQAAKKLEAIAEQMVKIESTLHRVYDICIEMSNSNEHSPTYSARLGKMFGLCFNLMQSVSKVEELETELNRMGSAPEKDKKNYTAEARDCLKAALNQLLIYQEIFFEGNPSSRAAVEQLISVLKQENTMLHGDGVNSNGVLLS